MIESKDNEELTKIGQCIKEKRNCSAPFTF